MRLILFFAIFLTPFHLMASPYEIIKEVSKISFSGTHADMEFHGEFQSWVAKIIFDKDDLSTSSVTVTIYMDSAKTGNAMYDGTLPSADWFDIANHPMATFQSAEFLKTHNGYKVTGDLTIRDITNSITFDFSLSEENSTIMTAEFPINRMDFDIGQESDPSAEWVSEIISLSLDLQAVKQ